jgi:Zn-dependent protease
MRRHTIPLGSVFGIPIGVDHSWFLVFILLTWLLAANYYPAEFHAASVVQYWAIGAVTAILFFVSVVLHELGHSVIALHYRIPVRSITLFIFGGIAQIGAEPPHAAAEFWIAVAGPVVSIALAGLCHLLVPLWSAGTPLFAMVEYLAFINLALALFNLIPGFPLDGGRVFRAIVWGISGSFSRATAIAAQVGRFFAYAFIILGVWQMFLGNLINGLWIAFIGWFLETAARSQLMRQRIDDMLSGHKVSEAMHRGDPEVPASTTLEELVDSHVLGAGRRSLLVEQDGNVVGLLTLHRIKDVPRERWAVTSASEAMIPRDQMRWVRPDAELATALRSMDRDGVNQLPVMSNGHAEGMLTREDAISYLHLLQELGI